MRVKVTVLGCGTSAGVPQIGCDCAVCASDDPRNKRLRTSILVETLGQRILFDTGPDLRQQCLNAGIGAIDALIYTHAHADHVHGLDDLRQLNNAMGKRIVAHADAAVFERIRARFPYAFEGGGGTHGFWRPDIDARPFDGPFEVGPVQVVPFLQKHGRGESWGFRVGPFGYATDTDGLDDAALAALEGIDVWIVDALRDKPHPSHAHLDMTLGWVERVRPRRTFLVHMNHEVDYATWAARLPEHVRPAHDGLVVVAEG